MSNSRTSPFLRVGIVGGGAGSVIGSSHRLAMRLSECFEIVAAAFDIDAARGRAFGQSLGIVDDRLYDDVDALIAGETGRTDGLDLVCVLTPNHTHFTIATKLLTAGFNLMCEKPITTEESHSESLVKLVADRGAIFGVMYGYTGYPMVRYARDAIAAGRIGKVRLIQSEFSLGSPSTLREDPDGHWRTKPGLSGPSAVVGMVGTHALYLSTFVSGLDLVEVAADFQTYVPGRELEDNANMLLRFSNGATGMMWNSYVAAGVQNGLKLRIYGELGGIEWTHEQPNALQLLTPGQPHQTITLASRPPLPGLEAVSIAAVQPEGFVEAFANVYRDVARAIRAKQANDPKPVSYPNVVDGALGVRFIAAAVESSRNNAAWVRMDGAIPI